MQSSTSVSPPNTPGSSTLTPNSSSNTIILSRDGSSSLDSAERLNEAAFKEILDDSSDETSSLSEFQPSQSDNDEFIEPILLKNVKKKSRNNK